MLGTPPEKKSQKTDLTWIVGTLEAWQVLHVTRQSARANTRSAATTTMSTEEELNPYELLNVGLEATEQDIKSAYRKLSLKVHPDRVRPPYSNFIVTQTHSSPPQNPNNPLAGTYCFAKDVL